MDTEVHSAVAVNVGPDLDPAFKMDADPLKTLKKVAIFFIHKLSINF
jgi:hypothetical protein